MIPVSNVFSTTGDYTNYNFPEREDIERLRCYNLYHNVYRGNHEYVFINSGQFKYGYDVSREYISINFCSAATKLFASRLFGQPASYSCDDVSTTDYMNYVAETNSLADINIKAARGASYRGDSVYKVRYDSNEQKILIETVDPAMCSVETDDLNNKKIVEITINNILCETDDKGKEQHFIWEEEHKMIDGIGWIFNHLYSAKKSKHNDLFIVDYENELPLESLEETANLEPATNTGLDCLMVVWVANDGDDECGIYGISDYEDLVHIQGELNNRYTQRAEILDKHSDPFLFGPEDLVDEWGTVAIGKNSKFIPLRDGEDGTKVVGYITWDAQLASVEKEIEELIRDFASIAQIDHHVLIDLTAGGNPPSGRALKLSQTRTQTRVLSKQLVFGKALKSVFSIVTKLAQLVVLEWKGSIKPLNEQDVVIEFSDGLPSDRMGDIEEQVAMVDGGVQSKVRAIQKLHGVSIEEAIKILDEIKSEQGSNAPVFTLGNNTFGQ